MLAIELDIFSGMPNPTWVLPAREEASLFERLLADPRQASPEVSRSMRLGLGYRGLLVRRIKSDDGPWEKALTRGDVNFPDAFRLGVAPVKEHAAADWLLRSANRFGARLPDEIEAVASRGVARIPMTRGPRAPGDEIDRKRIETPEIVAEGPLRPGTEPHETWWACGSNYFSANANFFNDPAHVTRNNCYCFASNHMADVRYALPGRRGGRPATAITCGGVIDGLRADGWKDGCQPNGLTIVMVIWPNYDYHFYRLVTGGPYWWWGHKPGGTPAKYTDDCGHAIYQYQGKGYAPNNICRGGYSDFCGYFYQDNWTAFVA